MRKAAGGRLFTETVPVAVDGAAFCLTIRNGRFAVIVAGTSRKTPWRIALRTDADALHRFWHPPPAPGFHYIFGLVKIGRGRGDGDILALAKNRRFPKEFMTFGREAEA